jgi:hypothetical protein
MKTKFEPATPLPWYGAGTGNHQGVVISEVDGANVAVAYDKLDVPYIVQAANAYPRLVAALRNAYARAALFGSGQIPAESEAEVCEEFGALLCDLGEL